MARFYRSYMLIAVAAMILFLGCRKDYLDPTQIGRFRPTPVVNVILDSLGVAEEAESAYQGAEDPIPADIVDHERDYTFSSGDTVRISIFELLQEGASYVDDYVVTESGNISIPEVGQIQAGGLTETQLEEEIRNALSPGILRNPSITVVLRNSLNRTFTVLGDGIANPNRYSIPRSDFRLLDALAVAGSARQFNVSYVYVARRLTGKEPQEDEFAADDSLGLKTVEQGQQLEPVKDKKSTLPENVDSDLLEVIEPSFSRADSSGFVVASAEMVTEEELEMLARPEGMAVAEPQDSEMRVSGMVPESQRDEPEIEWVFKDGKWVPVQVAEPQSIQPKPEIEHYQPQQYAEQKPQQDESLPETVPARKDYGWDDIQSAGIQTRVIRIPKDKLYGGDPRYNIVIKPQDTITVQLDVVGEFYVLGNVNNQGVINLTGRPMTLKMAIAAAGGLGQLAVPRKCEVIRRIGEKKEEIVMIDLEKIAKGTQPDFFIKPNDVINVGTDGMARFMYTMRNAFRATYGFGFLYDRNFGSKQVYEIVEDM